MSKYKIDVNSKLPSDDKIKNSMDFEKVLKTATSEKFNVYHARKKMHRKRSYIMWTVVIVAISLALLVTLNAV